MAKIQELETIDKIIKSYKRQNLTVMIVCCLIMLAALASGFWAYRQAAAQVFLVRDYRIEKITDKKAQIDAHLRMFYNLFFAIDQNNFQQKTTDALYLIGESGKELRQRYNEANWYNQIIQNNISISVHIDSIRINADVYPYKVSVSGLMLIKRESNLSTRRLDAVCQVEQTSNSYKNPFGLLIQNFIITNNDNVAEKKKTGLFNP